MDHPQPPDPPAGDPATRLVGYGCVVLGAALLALFQLHNDDAFFHVATGRWILQHGEVPLHNPFSYAGDGATWLQHQWLPAVGIAWIVDNWGVAALVCVKAAWVGMVFAVLAWHLDRARLPVGLAAAALAAVVIGSAFRFYERPYLCSILALAITATALLRWQRRRFMGNAPPSLALITTAVAWQLHAGALHSVLAWCALLGGTVVAWGVAWRGDDAELLATSRRALLRAGTWFVAMVVVSLVGLALFAPGGLAVIALPAHFSANAYWHAHLAEFRPLALTTAYLPQWLVVFLAAIVAVWALLQRRWAVLLLVFGFTALAVRHQRMVWAMGIATIAGLGALNLRVEVDRRLRGVVWRAGLLVFSLILLFAGWVDQDSWFRMGLGEDGLDRRRHPVALLQRAATLPGETFVSDGLAGTWLWLNYRDRVETNAPIEPQQQHRVLVHNCLECYKESTYIDTYQRIRYGAPDWAQMVERLGIRSFVLKYTTKGERRFLGGKPNVRQHLFASDDWLLVDFDDVAAVYVHRDHAPAGLTTLEPFPVDPDTGRARAGASDATIMVALLDHAARSPRVERSLDMARRRLRRMDALPAFGYSNPERQGEGAVVREYWRRWQNNRHGWPTDADAASSPHADALASLRAHYVQAR